MVLPLSLFRVENRACLSHGVQMIGATWQAATRIMAGVGDLVQRTGDGQAQVEYSLARRSRGQVTQCMVCNMHVETRSAGFLVEPQNQGRRFVSGLAYHWVRFHGLGLKTDSYGLVIWASKSL